MKPRTKLSAAFKAKYWAAVTQCLALFAEGREHAGRVARLRKRDDDLMYHMDPIEMAKNILGLDCVPDEVLARYRAIAHKAARSIN